ncbi:MAG: pseudouridine synthase [Wenzhouxiangella sp.]|jgi:tRNA pseudouridine65 synthase|nr:pseudouridine synthase [Wenzhouxiangella sp.]
MNSIAAPENGEALRILFYDRWLCAIDKPSGLMVHKTAIGDDRVFALQRLRDQLGQRVWPLHRLDRATSGVLLFALDADTAAAVGQQIMERQVDKRYLAVVRGFTEPSGCIDHPLSTGDQRPDQAAVTEYRRLATMELPEPVGRYPVARYSLVEVQLRTGRTHQIRRHFKHIFHPLIGDTTYGEGRHNRLFRRRFGCQRLLLHAVELTLAHPWTQQTLAVRAATRGSFRRVEEVFLRHSLR